MRYPFFIILHAEPTTAAINGWDLDGANVNVWVMESSIEAAVIAAQSHILGYAWIPRDIRYAGEVTGELIEAVDDVEAGNYEEALRSGVAAAFYGWTKETRSPEFFEYRHLDAYQNAVNHLIH